jgi:hypothetical protein
MSNGLVHLANEVRTGAVHHQVRCHDADLAEELAWKPANNVAKYVVWEHPLVEAGNDALLCRVYVASLLEQEAARLGHVAVEQALY